MRGFLTIGLILLFCGALFGQSVKSRDALKIGYQHVFVGKEDVFKPGVYLEYSRLFYPPISIAVTAGYTQANDIITPLQIRNFKSFNFDINALYAFLATDDNELQLGIGISARLFEAEFVELQTDFTGKDSFLRPGLNVLINYNQYFDAFFVGGRATVQSYISNGSVYSIGGHLGLRF